ncbi:sodium-dependent lysophosphatidylcholine symporter 1 isoform X6 [Columba livia]|uniref:sodium-dependent lysophosphatidylcholine symporter 1 isoform X6 n=1 Tax=Columba livia TaxID=8932 RepID=UPI0031BA25E6
MHPGAHDDAALHRSTQEGALPQRRVPRELQDRPGLTLCGKVCYAIGGIPYQMTGNALGFFFQIFLLDVVQLEPIHASLILFLGRAWDAVTDPAIGFLVSKSPRRKYGKLVPWIAGSMPFGVLCYCLMWSTLSDATPASLKFLWYLFMYSFFQTCMTVRNTVPEALSDTSSCTCHHVPYSSLTMFLGGTQRDRDSATAYRMGMEVFSTLLGSGIQGQIVGSYHARMMNGCSVSNKTLHNTSTHSLTDSLENMIAQGIFAFFCTHAAGLAGKFQHLVLIMLVTASLSIPFWQWFLGRFGKKTAASLGLALIIPALVAVTQVTRNFLAFIFPVMVAGCSMAVLYLLPWSMLPDAVDDFMLRNPGCPNLEALFYSFYVFFNKFAGGLAVGISTLSLHFAGYHAGDCTYNPSIVLTLQLLMAPIPISLLLIAIIIFCLHPINEERRKQMKMELEAMGHQLQRGNQE